MGREVQYIAVCDRCYRRETVGATDAERAGWGARQKGWHAPAGRHVNWYCGPCWAVIKRERKQRLDSLVR